MKRWLTVLALALAAAGCSTSGTTAAPLFPGKLQLTASQGISVGVLALGAAAAIYYIYDPLAPNWEIEESRLTDDTYRFSMKMKRYHTGGSGEALQIVKRRASQLQHEHGYGSYQLLEMSEGIDSQTLGARRVVEGVFKLVERQQADSFLLDRVN